MMIPEQLPLVLPLNPTPDDDWPFLDAAWGCSVMLGSSGSRQSGKSHDLWEHLEHSETRGESSVGGGVAPQPVQTQISVLERRKSRNP